MAPKFLVSASKLAKKYMEHQKRANSGQSESPAKKAAERESATLRKSEKKLQKAKKLGCGS